MALTRNTEREITVQDDGLLIVKRTVTSFDGTEEIGVKTFRYPLEPGADVTGEPNRVQNIANAVWTPRVVADYATKKAAALARALNVSSPV